MMTDEFILEENPFADAFGECCQVIRVLDETWMDPMERELVKRRLRDNIEKRQFIPFVPSLMKDYIEYYMEQDKKPLAFEVFGLDNEVVSSLVKRLMDVFGKVYCVSVFRGEVRGKNPNLVFGIHDSTPGNDSLASHLAEWKKNGGFPTLIIEQISVHREKGLVNCVLYDRMHNIHGFVLFKL